MLTSSTLGFTFSDAQKLMEEFIWDFDGLVWYKKKKKMKNFNLVEHFIKTSYDKDELRRASRKIEAKLQVDLEANRVKKDIEAEQASHASSPTLNKRRFFNSSAAQ